MAHRTVCSSGMAMLAVLAVAAGNAWGGEPEKDIQHLSPDHSVRARIHTDANGESTVRIEDTQTGALLLIRDDTSKDGSHGHAVVHSAWTPDSQFFVAGLEAAAEHPSWAHPVWVYSRESNHVVELWKLGISVVASFQLRSPDILQTRILAPRGNGRRAGQEFSTSLRSLFLKDHRQEE